MKERIREVIADVMGLDPANIPLDALQENVKGWDSIRHMNLVVALEQEFGVQFSGLQIAEMMGIELIEDTIRSLQS